MLRYRGWKATVERKAPKVPERTRAWLLDEPR
jgi:hypothetical protein